MIPDIMWVCDFGAMYWLVYYGERDEDGYRRYVEIRMLDDGGQGL